MGHRNTYKEALNNWINDKKADMVFDKDILIEDCDGKVHLNNVRENTVTNKVYILKVIFNNPATIVYWSDGERTVVKCGDNDIFDPEKGLAMAIAKKSLGNNGRHYNEIKKWLPNEQTFLISLPNGCC